MNVRNLEAFSEGGAGFIVASVLAYAGASPYLLAILGCVAAVLALAGMIYLLYYRR